MPTSFAEISIGSAWSRTRLATHWGYKAFQALARGVVTPANDNKILLFVTEEKQSSATNYVDALVGSILEWEGPKDHFAEQRILDSGRSGDQMHLFYRKRHHSDFIYKGTLRLRGHDPAVAPTPSKFVFELDEQSSASAMDIVREPDASLAVSADEPRDIEVTGTTALAFVNIRLNQAHFRRLVLKAYDSTCCMSGLNLPSLLVASHIVPWATDLTNRLNPRNGLCLSALHDRAFDQGLITVLPNLLIQVSTSMKSRGPCDELSERLLSLHNRRIRIPRAYAPDPKLLELHAKRFQFL